MTIEKTNDESTIITSSSVSILLAAVDACSPSQFGISMITEVTTVRTRIAAISLGRGRPRTGAFYSGNLKHPLLPLVPQATTGGRPSSSPFEAAITVQIG